MYEICDGVIKFILIDFDLATFVDDNGVPLSKSSSNHRTGTLPFMAWELVQDVYMLATNPKLILRLPIVIVPPSICLANMPGGSVSTNTRSYTG